MNKKYFIEFSVINKIKKSFFDFFWLLKGEKSLKILIDIFYQIFFMNNKNI